MALVFAREQAPFRLFAAGWTPPPACLPQRELFDTIESRCPVAIVNWFWFIVAGLPRVFIVLVGMAIVTAVDVLSGGEYPVEPHFLLYFGMFALVPTSVCAIGLRYWLWRDRRVAAFSAIVLAIDVGLYVLSSWLPQIRAW